jgi:hypothetical protein
MCRRTRYLAVAKALACLAVLGSLIISETSSSMVSASSASSALILSGMRSLCSTASASSALGSLESLARSEGSMSIVLDCGRGGIMNPSSSCKYSTYGSVSISRASDDIFVRCR